MLVWILLLGCSTVGDTHFDQGLTSIRSGDSAGALIHFNDALDAGARHPAVYHGLGNALYRMGREAEAAAAWRRGLALSPRNGDIAANLDWVRKRFTDRIEPPASHREAFFWHSFLAPLETCVLGALSLSIGFWVMVWGRVRTLFFKRFDDSSSTLFPILAIMIGLLLVGSSLDAVHQRRGAVVIVEEVDVRSALGPSGVSLFVLHAGAEVAIEEKTDTHRLLVLSDGRKGWVNAKALLSTDPEHPFVMTD